MPLNERQQRFALEYVKDGNAGASYRRAGYSEKGACQAAHKLLMNADVRAAVSEGVAKHFDTLDLELDRIIREAARVGISDIGDLFDEDGHLIPTHLLPHDIRKAISGIKVQNTQVDVEVQEDGERVTTRTKTTQTVEFKFWDKLKGLELVGKLKGLMKPQQLQLDAGDSWLDVLVRMTAAQAAAKESGEAAVPPPAARGAGTDHQGHHGSQG